MTPAVYVGAAVVAVGAFVALLVPGRAAGAGDLASEPAPAFEPASALTRAVAAAGVRPVR